MIKGELGLIEDKKQPSDAEMTTFTAFNLVGLIPLIHYKLTEPFYGISPFLKMFHNHLSFNTPTFY
jgi:hypothetical protein